MYYFMVQPLRLAATSNRRLGRDEKQRLFLCVGEAFLSEDSEAPLSLANQALWNDLAATYASLKAGLQVKISAILFPFVIAPISISICFCIYIIYNMCPQKINSCFWKSRNKEKILK